MAKESKLAAMSLLDAVADIKTDGLGSVLIALKSRIADLPFIMSVYDTLMMPNTDGVADWQSGVRTGPFTLESFEPGVSAKLKRNPNYFKNSKPYLDEAEIIAITDVAARMSALTTSKINYINRVDLKTLGMLKRNPNIKIIEPTGYTHNTLPVNTTVAHFDNADVRMAFKHAINCDEIVQKFFLSHATFGNDSPIAPHRQIHD